MFARIKSPGSSPGSSTSTRCRWTPNVPLYSGVWRASTYRWMRLVLPTARSPTTLIFSFRRRIRKESARRWPASKGLRAGYHALNSANGPLGRDRTGGNPSSALGGISFRTMDSGGAKITLDQESFKALASDVRVGIAVALAAIGAFLALSAEAVFAPGSRLLNASAPSAERSVLSGPIGYAALAFGLAIASGLVALALRFIGQRRRDRFFEQLRAA